MLTKPKYLAAALVLITLCGISPVSAQMNGFGSNTGKATNGLYSTETDKFLDVNNWQELEFRKFFSAFQVEGINGIGAGLAVETGSVYLGFGYFGKFWSGSLVSTTTEYGKDYSVPATWAGKQIKTNNSSLAWTNQISVLFGTDLIGGILVDLNLAGFGLNNNDRENLDAAGEISTDFKTTGPGIFGGGITWGKNFTAKDAVIKPYLGIVYNSDLQKTKEKSGTRETTTLNGTDPFFGSQSGYVDIQDGKVGYSGSITARGGFGIDNPGRNADNSIWLEYNFETHTYSNQLADSTDYWEKYNPVFTAHHIKLGAGSWYNLDRRLSFSWLAEGDIGLINAKITSKQDSTSYDLGLDPDHEYTDLHLGIFPKIAAGVCYKAIPDKLNFNAGFALYPLDYIYRKFNHTDMAYTGDTLIQKSNKISTAYTTASLGLSWLVTNGFLLDIATDFAAGATRVDLTTFSILLSYKY